MRRFLIVSISACSIAALAAPAGATFVHDFYSEFSTSSNPNGVWRYQTVSQASSTPKTSAANDTFNVTFGNWADNPTQSAASEIGVSGSIGFLRPGSSTDALVGFVFPDALSESVHFHIELPNGFPNASGDGKTVTLWLNNTNVTLADAGSTTIALANIYAVAPIFDFYQTMVPGDIFYLRINDNSNDNFDATGLTLTFSTPEPSSLVLFGLSVVGFLLALGRRNARRL